MYKNIIVILALATVSMAAPKPGVLAAYTAPVVAPAVVTAQSSQYFSRTYNGLVTPVVEPLIAEPIVKAAHVVAAAPVVKAAPLVAAPVAYSTPYYNPYVASPYLASPYIAAPTSVFV